MEFDFEQEITVVSCEAPANRHHMCDFVSCEHVFRVHYSFRDCACEISFDCTTVTDFQANTRNETNQSHTRNKHTCDIVSHECFDCWDHVCFDGWERVCEWIAIGIDFGTSFTANMYDICIKFKRTHTHLR